MCLIVDDEPSIRAYLKAILQTEGFEGLEADDAPKAFRLIQKLNGGLDLVVTDVNMPGDMDGLDLAYAIRDAFPAIRVIVMSGYSLPGPTKRPLGEFVFLEKPFKPETILNAVKKTVVPLRRTAAPQL
jgi:DNA-binding NtrC family response regulator